MRRGNLHSKRHTVPRLSDANLCTDGVRTMLDVRSGPRAQPRTIRMRRMRRGRLLSERHRVHSMHLGPRRTRRVFVLRAVRVGLNRDPAPGPMHRLRIGNVRREWDDLRGVRPRPRRARVLVRMHGLRRWPAHVAHARLLLALSAGNREPLALRHVLLELLRRHVRNGRRRVRGLPRGRVLRGRRRQVRDLRRGQLLGEAEHGVLQMRKGECILQRVGKMRHLSSGLVCERPGN